MQISRNTERFMKSEDLTVSDVYFYYEWPLFFLLNRVTTMTMKIDLSLATHIIYFLMSVVISTVLYKYALDHNEDGYISVMSFAIILFWFINYQWSAFFD